MPSTDQTSEAPATKKATYRITNWPEYDRALVARGDITFWFNQEAITQRWMPAPTGKRGAPWRYSDWSIQTLLVLKQVFHLPYRSLEGFGRSLRHWCIKKQKGRIPLSPFSQDTATPTRTDTGIPR
ncbi:transposase [Allochromatium palmeri]|uniref:Transposase DDE domain-containing protein n=1 Tax=Allochromatium palmeri TaxID=231048 RepID=A0A6N8EJ83_9GAMM|nr:transposase [Allochromatium palmeri]MTW22989.1 hypothetical protein [Allochromatium palmeri]